MEGHAAASQGTDTQINYTMKILFAFAITFIVAGHVLIGHGSGGISFGFNVFPPASFHVAIFLFVAGYFYKPAHEAAPGAFVKKKVLRLLVPLYLINAVYGVWVLVAHALGFTFGNDPTLYNLLIDPLFGGHAFMWDCPLWFIAPMFLAEMFDFGLRKLLRVGTNKRKELVLIVLYLVLGLTTTTLCGSTGFPELSSSPLVLLARTGFFLPCYAFGRTYRVFLEAHDKMPNWLYFGVVIGLQLLLIIICQGKVTYLVSWCQYYTGPVIPFLTTALGIAFWLRISHILEPGLKNSPSMRAVADNTYGIMANQFVGIFLVKAVFACLCVAGLCASFDMNAFFTDFWYYYYPHELQTLSSAFGILYVAAGVAVPIGMHRIWRACYARFKGLLTRP